MMKSRFSRREFFTHLKHGVGDQISPDATILFANQSGPPVSHWIAVGRVSEMAPGARKSVDVKGKRFVLQASADGIWLISERGRRIAIRTGVGGVIFADTSVEWPDHRILSHSSGEVRDLNDLKPGEQA